MIPNPADGFCADRAHGSSGSAKRRRERRLRSWWRHEAQSVRAAVATVLHHSCDVGRELYNVPRHQKMATAREEVVNEPYDALRGLTTPPPGERPALLVEVQPQGCVERHVVEDPSELAPMVQFLDSPVPQMVDTVLEFFRALDLPVGEQVIAVPQISTERVSQRLVERRLPQMVEQLVEGPTVLTPTRIALQIAEQLVNIPVPQVSVSGGGHQGSLSGQGSVGEQIVDNPVLRGRGKRRVQGFLPEQRTTAQSVEQTVDIPASSGRGRRGGHQGLPRGQGSTASPIEQTIGVARGGLQGFSPGHESGQRSAEQNVDIPAPSFRSRRARRTAEQNVDIPVRRSRAHGGLQGFSPGQSSSQRIVPGDEDDPPERFGTVLVASGDRGPGVIRADDGKRFRFQLPSWFIIPVGARVAFRAEEGLEVGAAYDVYCWYE